MTAGDRSRSSRAAVPGVLAGGLARFVQSHPLVPVALLLVVGIGCRDALAVHPRWWLGIASVSLLLGQFHRTTRIAPLCLLICGFFAGLCAAQESRFFFPGDALVRFAGATPQMAHVEVRLVEPPRQSGGTDDRAWEEKQSVMAEARGIETWSGWRSASGLVRLSVSPPIPTLAAGQVLRVRGWLAEPLRPDNPGQFNWAEYDREHHVLVTLRVTRTADVVVVGDAAFNLTAWLRSEAEALLKRGFAPTQSQDQHLLSALLLGESDASLQQVRDDFNATGTAYQLSVSGLHLGILVGAMLLMGRVLRRSPRGALVLTAAAVAAYACIIAAGVSGERAILVWGLAAFGIIAGRQLDGINLLAAAVVLLAIQEPADVRDAGFQIGVTAVVAILVLARPVMAWAMDRVDSDDPWRFLRPEGKSALPRRLAFRVGQLAMVSGVVWIAVMPLVAFHFQQVSAWAVPAGLLLLPLTAASLLAGVAKLGLTLVCPPASSVWAIGAAFPVMLLRRVVVWAASLPGSGEMVRPPTLLVIVGFYALLLAPLFPWRGFVKHLSRAGPLLACVLLLIPLPGGFDKPSPGLHLTLLSIGAGQTGVVETPDGRFDFFDCGSTTLPNVYASVIHPYLQTLGVRQIDAIFLSHGDYDHISAALNILRDYPVGSVHMTPYLRLHAGESKTVRELLAWLSAHPAVRVVLELQGTTEPLGVGTSAEILWPPTHCDMSSNDCGMVVKLHYAGHSLLLPADIQVLPELAMLRHRAVLAADVLVAPHHGSAETSTAAFISAIAPRWIVCSNSGELTHKQVLFDEIARRWPEYRTSGCGAIDVSISPGGEVAIHCFREER